MPLPLAFPFGLADSGGDRQAVLRGTRVFSLPESTPILVSRVSSPARPSIFIDVISDPHSSTGSQTITSIAITGNHNRLTLSDHDISLLPLAISNVITNPNAGDMESLIDHPHTLKQCAACRRWESLEQRERMQICSGCEAAWFCDISCARQGWHDHKPHCLYHQGLYLLKVLEERSDNWKQSHVAHLEESNRLLRELARLEHAWRNAQVELTVLAVSVALSPAEASADSMNRYEPAHQLEQRLSQLTADGKAKSLAHDLKAAEIADLRAAVCETIKSLREVGQRMKKLRKDGIYMKLSPTLYVFFASWSIYSNPLR